MLRLDNPKVNALSSEVLRQLVQFLRVHEFRSEEPDLEQIFLTYYAGKE